MEAFFQRYRTGIAGQDSHIRTSVHDAVRLVYADWTASGRIYSPIEERLRDKIFPYVANTHTDTNYTGSLMTYSYHLAQKIIKRHVGAGEKDVLISSNSGMTGVINKFQRILGLRLHESFRHRVQLADADRPVVFVTHMEHHSNQTSWLETIAEVVVVEPDAQGLVSVDHFRNAFEQYSDRKHKIAAVTSCSNVTGIMTPYMDIAELIHEHGGLCFVDFACSAPYVTINMHPEEGGNRYLDAIYFSPHKFLGGPGTTGILVFNEALYRISVPDHPGGGTVDWTNPWGEHKYVDDIESREDGGTPAFLQTIKAAMCMQLKDEMGVDNIQKREHQILDRLFNALADIPNLHILAGEHRDRLGIISFYVDGLHYNLGVKMLNDRFGIQTRGGCSCAGTYGHYLLKVDREKSQHVASMISQGDCSLKPGWIRLSIHPTHTDDEIDYMIDALRQLCAHHREWEQDYLVDARRNSVRHKNEGPALALEKEVDDHFLLRFAD